MKRWTTLILGIALACSSATSQLVKSWREPTYTGREVKRVLVIALAPVAKNQQVFEYEVAGQLVKAGLKPYPGSDVLPKGKMADEAAIMDVVKKEAIDVVLVTKLVTVRSEKEYVPGAYQPVPAYHGVYSYYSAGYSTVYAPGYVNEAKAAYLETNAYDVASNRLVWSGLTRTFDYSSVDNAVRTVAPTIVRALQEQGIL